jgi:integrative and conjugative element protein (TIGR02256 family)
MFDINFEHSITIHIHPSIISTIRCYSQGDSDFEAGGILLGKKLTNSDDYTISEMTCPNQFDTRTRFSFLRNKKVAQRIINERWATSNGIVNYLGEWHTHPFPSPMPSMTDQLLLNIIAREKSNVFMYYFMIILGSTGKLFVGISSSNNRGKIIDYKVIEV